MGTVHLTNGHHGLYIREKQNDLEGRVLLDAELLARPIQSFYDTEQPVKEQTQDVVRAALQALMDMRGFNAAVSFHVKEKKGVRHIYFPHRVWGEITLGTPDAVVVGFSHDTRYENRPFYRLLQWLEEEYPDGQLSEEDFAQFAKKWSSVERWQTFFQARIERSMQALYLQAEALRREKNTIMQKAMAIESALERD